MEADTIVSGHLDQPPIDKRADDGSVPGYIKVGNTLFLDGDVDEPVIIKYIGGTKFNKKGIWIGIALRKPTGKHGGLVDGHRYFTCKPKHGLFVRSDRLYEDYVCPGDGTKPNPTEKKTKSKKASRPKVYIPATVPPKRSGKSAAAPRRHPVLDKPIGQAGPAKKELRYYIDLRGRTMHTLKAIDPFGRPTKLLHEPIKPTVCDCKNHARDHAANGCSAHSPKEEREVIVESATPQTSTPSPTKVSIAVGDDNPIPDGGDNAAFVISTSVTSESTSTSNEFSVQTDFIEHHQSESTVDIEENTQSETTIALERKLDVANDPHATGFSDDDEDEEVEEEWMPLSKGFDLQEFSKQDEKPKRLSTVAECSAMANRIKKAAIKGDWDAVRDILCDEAAELGVEETTLADSGLGRVVGKLRNAQNPMVVFAADAVIDAWKFQLKLEPKDNTRHIQAKLAHFDAQIKDKPTSINTTSISGISSASECASETDDDARTPARELKEPNTGDETVVRTRRQLLGPLETLKNELGLEIEEVEVDGLDDLDEDQFLDKPNVPDGPRATPGKMFVGLNLLEQCEQIQETVKQLVAADDWNGILELLRGDIARMLMTEDVLKRSGIGRMMSKLVKKAPEREIQLVAQEIIEEWKDHVGYRDLIAERRDAAEMKEREKFLEFMNLKPVALHGASGKVDEVEGESVEEDPEPDNTTLYYEKKFELLRGPKDKTLGFKLTLARTATDSILATVMEVLPGGLADRAQREGCKIEDGDELIEINGQRIANCEKAEILALLKEPQLTLTLRSVVPGSETTNANIEEADLYNTTPMPVYHNVRVNPSDFITLSTA